MSDLGSVGQHFMVGLRPTPTLHPQDRQLLQVCARPASFSSKAIFRMIFHIATGSTDMPV
jgi:hypothetical protein